jgi:hypothetical protein
VKTYNDILLDRYTDAGEITFIRNHVTNTDYIVPCQSDESDFGGLAEVIDIHIDNSVERGKYTDPARAVDSTTFPKEAACSADFDRIGLLFLSQTSSFHAAAKDPSRMPARNLFTFSLWESDIQLEYI